MSASASWFEIRQRTKEFLEQRIYPAESILQGADKAVSELKLAELMQQAKAEGLWALGHPKEIGGQGMPFLDYVYINEVIGRSEYAQRVFGTYSLQDSLMLKQYASPQQQEQYLRPLVAGEICPSFAMTEPALASSDPTQLQTSAVLEGGHWRINGHKWFTTGADIAAYTTIMCRTEPDAPDHKAFSMIIVPTDSVGYEIVRDTPLLLSLIHI